MVAPGLQKLNIPQNKATTSFSKTSSSSTSSDLKHVAARNMSNASRATGATSYGIFAQRSKVGSGGIFNIKTFYGDSIAAQRRYLNSNRQVIDNNFYGNQKCSGSDNGMNKFMAAMMAANTLAQLGAQTADAVKSMKGTSSVKGSKNTNNSNNVGGNNDTKLPASLSAMKGAKDSSTLRGAIESAKADKFTMTKELQKIEQELPQMEEAANVAKQKLESLRPKLAKAEEKLGLAEKNKKQAESNKNSAEKAVENAKGRLESSKAGLVSAQENLVGARAALGQAKANLAATPETITDSNGNTVPNPQYSQAKEMVADAEKNVAEMEKAYNEANADYKAANDNDRKAHEDFSRATKSLADSTEECARQTDVYNNAKVDYENAKDEVEKNAKISSDFEKALSKQAELKANISSIEAEIPAQEKRLTQLEQSEINGEDGATNTINKMDAKIANNKTLSSKDEKKLNEAKELKRNISYTKLYQTQGTKIGSQTFRTGEYNGETLYMIGAKKVDKQEYDLKKGLAETNQKLASQMPNNNLNNYTNPDILKKMQEK